MLHGLTVFRCSSPCEAFLVVHKSRDQVIFLIGNFAMKNLKSLTLWASVPVVVSMAVALGSFTTGATAASHASAPADSARAAGDASAKPAKVKKEKKAKKDGSAMASGEASMAK